MNTETSHPAYERARFEQSIAQVLAHDMAVHARLARRTRHHAYALVDAGQCGPLDEKRQDDGALSRWVLQHRLDATPLFLQMPEASIAGAGPWLIELPGADSGEPPMDLLADLANTAGLCQALSLLASPLSGPALAVHLRSWLEGVIPPDPAIPDDEEAGAILRWYDPRVGFDMVACWPPPLRDEFLRPFSWAGWDAGFHPRGLRCSQPRAPQSAVRQQPLILDPAFLQAMAALNRADDLLADVLDRSEPDAFAPIAPALRRWVALDQVEQARLLGIAERESQITLLHHALTLHPDLSRLNGFKDRLDHETRQGRELAHLLAAQSTRWWQEHRQAAQGVWSRWALHFLEPLRGRLDMGDDNGHPFATLLPPPRPAV